MSGSHPGQTGAQAEGADPSMEDILASIRRILSEDEAEATVTAAPATAESPASAAAHFNAPDGHHAVPPAAPRHDDVLDLDAAMIVEDAAMSSPIAHVPSETVPSEPLPSEPVPTGPVQMGHLQMGHASVQNSAAEPAAPLALPPLGMTPPPIAEPRPAQQPLVAPEAAAATAASVGTLLRTLAAGREQIPVHRGGPTIEDMVREEIRPLLKAWLDTNLPPLVERVVRSEMERVVGRVA